MTNLDYLSPYWTPAEIAANAVILLHLAGALFLGLLVGYERSYHGRAAGMRTYGLVCMASCALTIISGFPEAWFGGQVVVATSIDPTRVMQGVVTGIGFLGAGVIMRDGFNISGLTTAASIWTSSVIGILIGVGFYLAAMGLAFFSAMIMIYLNRVESLLPSRRAVAVTLRFREDFLPREETLRAAALERGYQIANSSLTVASTNGQQEWRFVALALSRHNRATLTELAAELAATEGVEGFQLTHARN